jgi:triacylglycerol lipase
MITLVTRLLLLFQLLIAAGLFLLLQKELHSAVAAALSIGTVLLFRLLITANNFFLAWRYRSETPCRCRIGWRQALRLFADEFKATMTTSSWTMPFHAFSSRISSNPRGLPVLLIHGYGCNSGYWHAMSKALSIANISHRTVDMEPVLGSIDEYVPLIQDAAKQLCKETGHRKLVIVAHSMGGLAARAYLRVHGAGRVAKVITLGTPHHGTALASYGAGLNTRQMHWAVSEQEGLSSEWLRTLAASEDPSTYGLFVSIYSHHDNIIAPQTSSHLHGAKNIEFHAIGHVSLASDPRIQMQVVEEIRSASESMPLPESASGTA